MENMFPRNPRPPQATVVLGGQSPAVAEPVKDWRERYVTLERFENVKPPSFLIENFLEYRSITAIGAPVAQRKSIVVANIIRSCLTGAPLFDKFEVKAQPKHVIYLCPEMGLIEIADRFKRLGLTEYVGSRLFIRSMDDKPLKLTDLCDELPDSLLVLDTITRFVSGDQNSAEDMAKFADLNYAINRQGATIILLHHSKKNAANEAMTLDSALRGSTELAAFVTCVWSTQLEDQDAPHTTNSNLKCVKQRGFPSEPFQVSCDSNALMAYLGGAEEVAERINERAQEIIARLVEADPDIGIHKIRAALKAAGLKKGVKWVTEAKGKLRGTGVSLTQS